MLDVIVILYSDAWGVESEPVVDFVAYLARKPKEGRRHCDGYVTEVQVERK